MQEGNMTVSCASELMVEMSEEEEEDRLEVTTADAQEDTSNEGGICPPPSPARIKATTTTPTFSLKYDPFICVYDEASCTSICFKLSLTLV